MSLRLILIIIGALIIAAILIDGYRHWRKTKKYQQNLEKNTVQQPTIEPVLAETKAEYIEDLDFTPRINVDTVSDEVRVKPNPNPPPPLVQPRSTVATPSVKNASRKIPEPMPKKNKFIILHVLAEDDTYFSAPALAAKFTAQGLRFGPMNIFHQYENYDGTGDVLFSVANAFEPGTLDLDSEDEDFYTQGLTLFIQLPHRADAQEAFENMLSTATLLSKAFNARLCDQNRQPLTAAKVEEYRNEVMACNVI